MKTQGVSSAIITAVRAGVTEQLSTISELPFDGANIQLVEKEFIETIGKSGTSGLIKLFACNDEPAKAVIHDGQKHYRTEVIANRVTFLDRQAASPIHEEKTDEADGGDLEPEDIPF